MRKLPILVAVIVVALVLVLSSLFVVDERQKALVLQFGQIKAVKEEPGLAFKIPFIQEVVYYDDRILSLDTSPTEVTPSDDRRLVVDAFARYRIADVVRFRQAVSTGGIARAESDLEGILIDRIRAVLGADGVTSNTILSSERARLMQTITEQSRARGEVLGIEVLDVRLKQTNLPEQNLDATFARMRAEREREAADERARGEEAAQRVRAQADRTVVELESDARRQAEITRGEADAEKNRIFAEAYGADPEFFEFYRSLNAYRAGLRGENTTLVISPDSEFFDYLSSDQGRGAAPATAPQPAAPQTPAADQ
ncbi:protease modulator HflC [Celeribacter indicus]|uniref:Protein HflC n=1 Tax=Celeribacter indicus TaxID=1208324 RepID=A0A0B5DXQ8_9RHOB|nr:protease modulator HflC [Celeribacter indicus]AJE48218.1 HflC protein [Celeribacter indicus]SDW69791.1 protease FtsH subunit HflC [Celeribacter indicus]